MFRSDITNWLALNRSVEAVEPGALTLAHEPLESQPQAKGTEAPEERPNRGSDEGTESTTGYEAVGSVSFVFQLFYSEDNAHLIGVFRRLCGDVIAFNDKYRQFMETLRADKDNGLDLQ